MMKKSTSSLIATFTIFMSMSSVALIWFLLLFEQFYKIKGDIITGNFNNISLFHIFLAFSIESARAYFHLVLYLILKPYLKLKSFLVGIYSGLIGGSLAAFPWFMIAIFMNSYSFEWVFYNGIFLLLQGILAGFTAFLIKRALR